MLSDSAALSGALHSGNPYSLRVLWAVCSKFVKTQYGLTTSHGFTPGFLVSRDKKYKKYGKE